MTGARTAAAAVASWVAMSVLASACQRPPPPPVLKPLPAFSLTAEDGSSFGSAELAGGPYVASFFFSTCPSVCPRIIKAVGDVQRRSPGARLVSITVDPATDTPAVLAAYARTHGADPARWRFLTGPEDAVRAAVVDGFMNPIGEREAREDGLFDIAHGSRLMLIDGQNRLRALYEPDAAGVEALVSALAALEGE